MVVFANAGVPMLVVAAPYLAALLIPVVLIEALWYWRFLRVPWSQAWEASLAANVWSTFVGIPLGWFVGVCLSIASMSALSSSGLYYHDLLQKSKWLALLYLAGVSAWVPPFEEGLAVAVWAASLVLLLPAYLISYIGEAGRVQKCCPNLQPQIVYRQVWLAHLLSYGLLYAVAGYFYIRAAYG